MPIGKTSLPPLIGRRKGHSKSRLGCAECRRRRVKCSEEKPRCHACIRYEVPCLYPSRPRDSKAVPGDTTASPGVHHSTVQQSPASFAAESPACPFSTASPSPLDYLVRPELTSTGAFSIADLGLLHHWTVSTSMAMVGPPQVNRCWQDTLPRIALRYPFLMHAILSLSALHLAYTNTATKEQHSLDAVRHYDTSLKGFREAIHNIDIDNCHALFGCSTLNAICVIGLLGSHDDHTSTASRTSDFLGINYIPTIRGVKAVLHPRYQEVRTGPLGLLLSLQDWKELDPDGVPSPEAERFRNLGTIWLDSVDRHIYDEALGVLRKCQAYSFQAPSVQDDTAKRWGYNESWNRSILFIHFASEEYFTRLYQRQPHALVLFAYFAVLLHGLNGYWFFRGWGRGIVEVVDKLLGDYWRPWMEWPKYIVGM